MGMPLAFIADCSLSINNKQSRINNAQDVNSKNSTQICKIIG